LRTYRVEVAYVGGVCLILILKAWQVSKGQQSLTHSMQIQAVNIYMWFPNLECMAMVGIQALSHKELIM
jgi:hypothetical protein